MRIKPVPASKKRAIELLGIIRTEAEAGKQVLVIAPKDMTEAGSLTEIPELKALWNMPNVQVINHFHAEGVNEYSHCEVAFIFHFEPLPTEIESIARRIFRDDTLCFDREKTTLKKAGVILENVNRYKDPRVQSVFDRECDSRIMQAITRLRPMIYSGKRFYLLTSEPVSNLPVKPVPVEIDDLTACQAEHGSLESLGGYLESKASQDVCEKGIKRKRINPDGLSTNERTANRYQNGTAKRSTPALHYRKLDSR